MSSDQSTTPNIGVLPNRDGFERAIEAIMGDSLEPVPEERLRRQIVANHWSLSETCDESEQAVQISKAIERGLLIRDDEGLLRLNDSDDITSVSKTRIL